MLSGKIRVHEVAIVDGDMKLILHAKEMKKSAGSPLKLNVNWDELLQVRAEAVAIENTKIHLEAADTGFTADLVAERLRLAQWHGRDGLGYELRADLKDINSSLLKDYLPTGGISRISAVAHVNAAGALIDDILTVSDGLELRASGTIKGNLLADRNLELDSRVNLNGDVETISGYFKLKNPLGVAGHVKFNGRLKGNLSDLVRTARADGKLDAQNVKYQAWTADQVAVQASYTGLSKGGEFAVSDAQISSREIPRVGGNQPGHGGKIEIGAFKYTFGETRLPHEWSGRRGFCAYGGRRRKILGNPSSRQSRRRRFSTR
jgi:cytoskeletal protein CcmA (bactofilin family)